MHAGPGRSGRALIALALVALALVALGAPAHADPLIGAGVETHRDRLGTGSAIAATIGASVVHRGDITGWWQVTGTIGRADLDGRSATTRGLRVGPRVVRCAGATCIGLVSSVGLERTGAADGSGGEPSDRAIVDLRGQLVLGLDPGARVAVVAELGVRGALALSWSPDAPPADRLDHGLVGGLMLVIQP
jgi:hypothetical protein